MIILKTQNEIELMAEGGKILAEVLQQTSDLVKPGITTEELNDFAEKLILENSGKPSFKNYQTSPSDPPFPTTLCTSINSEIVHGPATPGRILKEGDIIGLDIGMEYKGCFTDMAVTVPVGKINNQASTLLSVTKKSLELAIDQVKPGNKLSDIGIAIQKYVEKAGFSVVRELVGHGVGKGVHEEPKVPNYLTEESKFITLKPGMTIAIEPMVNVGDWPVKIADDDWTFVTQDNSLSAQFEHTIAIDHHGKTRVLTKL